MIYNLLGLVSALNPAVPQQLVIHRHLSELVLDHGQAPAVPRRQDMIDERRLPSAEKSRDHCHRQARSPPELLAPFGLSLLPQGCCLPVSGLDEVPYILGAAAAAAADGIRVPATVDIETSEWVVEGRSGPLAEDAHI